MTLNDFFEQLDSAPESIEFADTMAAIDSAYHFTPTPFKNGDMLNQAGQNSGSCKLLAFAKLHGLSEQQVLACFGAYYREEVRQQPDADNHRNIRNFIKTGWAGVVFDGQPLQPL